MIKRIKAQLFRIYRVLWDFPANWEPYGWKKTEMTNWYWKGETA